MKGKGKSREDIRKYSIWMKEKRVEARDKTRGRPLRKGRYGDDV